MNKTRNKCPFCNRLVVILPNGNMAGHNIYVGQIHWLPCQGSGKTVAQAETIGRRDNKKEKYELP